MNIKVELQPEADLLAEVTELRREQRKLEGIAADLISTTNVGVVQEIDSRPEDELSKRIEGFIQSLNSEAVAMFKEGLDFNKRTSEMLANAQDMQLSQEGDDSQVSDKTLKSRIQILRDELEANSRLIAKFQSSKK